MFYKVSKKRLLSILNRILLNAIKVLEEQGFEKSPFSVAWYGRTDWSWGGISYELARLSNSYLEYITFYITRGDRFIGAELNIFELSPTPKSLSELNGVKGVAFFNPPASHTIMYFFQLPYQGFFNYIFRNKQYKLKSFFTKSGLVKRQNQLEKLLKREFKNIDLKIELWHKAQKPVKTDWEGNPIT